MGYYINPTTSTKEAWLKENAKAITRTHAENFDLSNREQALVVLINNGAFTAAGIAYDNNERAALMYEDGRPRNYFVVETEKLNEDVGLGKSFISWYKARKATAA